jgi:DNA repair protein RadC
LKFQNVLLRDIPEEERPRERLMRLGAKKLSNSELIALLLRTGSAGESVIVLAHRVLSQIGSLKELTRTTFHELIHIHGIGPAKAIQLLAGVELGRRISCTLPMEKKKILSPFNAAQYVMEELRYEQQEHFICLFLNTKNEVMDKKCIFKGSLNSSIVHPREIFSEAIKRNSASIICVHNHPSGDSMPSKEDLKITQRLVEAGYIIGIELMDHVIIGDRCYFSMKEKGLLQSLDTKY